MSRAPAPHLETEILSAYLDGQLSAAERGRVESHLQGCADCARRLAGLRSAIASLQSLDRVEPPAELFAEVRRRAAQVAPESAGGPLAWIAWPARHPGFAGASLAVLATVVALVYHGLGGAPPGPPAPLADSAVAPVTSASPAESLAKSEEPQPAAIPAAPRPADRPAPRRAAPRGIAGGVQGGVEGGVPGGIAGGIASSAPAPPPPQAVAPQGALEIAEEKAPAKERGEVRRDQAMRVAPAPAMQGAPAEEVLAGGRRFVRDALGWREVGIPATAVARTSVPVDSATGRALLVRLGDLRRRMGPGDRLLLYDGGRVIELRGPAAPEPR